jgi:hypothetical protein
LALNLKSGEMKNLFAEDNYQNVDVNLSRTAEYLIVGRIEVEDGQYLSKNQLWLARREADDRMGSVSERWMMRVVRKEFVLAK